MKTEKHNKKRNPAILYNILVQEVTRSIMENDMDRKKVVVSLLKEFFSPKRQLGAEFRLFKEFDNLAGVSKVNLEKIFAEIYSQHSRLDQKKLNSEKSQAISKINKTLGKQTFDNFIPNFKKLASISNFFSTSSAKSKILVEQKLIEDILTENGKKEEMEPIDNIVFVSFVKKFNEKYGRDLLKEQKELLGRYIMSDEEYTSISLKLFVNEEIGRLKSVFSTNKVEEFEEESKGVLRLLESYRKEQIDDEMIETILKIQQLADSIAKESKNV